MYAYKIAHCLYDIIYHFIDITINFSKPSYNIDENGVSVQPMLVLSNPSSTNFTVKIMDDEGTAKSKYTNF